MLHSGHQGEAVDPVGRRGNTGMLDIYVCVGSLNVLHSRHQREVMHRKGVRY